MNTYFNEKNIACLDLEYPKEKDLIPILKNNGFRYIASIKAWCILGFDNLDRFNGFVIACINNNEKEKRLYKPLKAILINQAAELKKGSKNKRVEYVESMKKQLFEIVEKEIDFENAAALEKYVTEKNIAFWKWYSNNQWNFKEIVNCLNNI